jgi:hypothetical protein
VQLLEEDGPIAVRIVAELMGIIAAIKSGDYAAILAQLSAAQVDVTALIAAIKDAFDL